MAEWWARFLWHLPERVPFGWWVLRTWHDVTQSHPMRYDGNRYRLVRRPHG